ncbi:hypothetical protein MTO96_031080 [Rhipicephalus appendiculatus]
MPCLDYKGATLAGLQVPVSSGSGITHPPLTKPGHPVTPSLVPMTPRRPWQHLEPPQRSGGDVCTSHVCRFASQWLRPKLDETKNPCEDFYGYVCGNHTAGTAGDQLDQVSCDGSI